MTASPHIPVEGTGAIGDLANDSYDQTNENGFEPPAHSGETEGPDRLNSDGFIKDFGRGEWIRTTDPSVPKRPAIAGAERPAPVFPCLPSVSSRPGERPKAGWNRNPFPKFPKFWRPG